MNGLTKDQSERLQHFLDGVPTGVYIRLTAYDPACMDFDGIQDHVPGIAVQAIRRDPDGAIWHEGIVLIPLIEQSYTTLMTECNLQCQHIKWINGIYADWKAVRGK